MVTVTIEAKLLGVWTDITADRAHRDGDAWSIFGGGQGVGPGDVVADPGAFEFFLDNSATNATRQRGCYSPNAMSPRAGWGLNTPVRIGITVGANPPYYKFAGWVDEIIVVPGLYDSQIVQVTAVDWVAIAATAPAQVPIQLAKRGDELLTTLAATITPAPFATSFDLGPDTYTEAFDDVDPSATMADSVLVSIARSGVDRIYVAGDASTGGVLRFESHSFRRSFTTDAFVLADSVGGGLGLAGLETARRRADGMNQLRFTIDPRRVDSVSVILYALNIDAATVQSIPPVGGSITIWADYVDPTQTAQAVAGTSMVAPVATTDYLFNSLANGAGTNLTASVTVTATFFAKTAKLVITNAHATLAAFPTFLQLRGKGVYTYQALTAESPLVAPSNPVLETIDQPYQSVIGQSQAAADYLLTIRTSSSWSQLGAIQAFCPVSDEAALYALLRAEVSTAFSITETMSGFLNYPLWVNGWQVDIDERDNMTFTFYGEPRDPNQDRSLGVASLSELGNTTYLGPF